MEETPRQRLTKQLEALRTERSSWITHWTDIANFVAPRGYRDNTSKRNDGSKVNDSIIDNTATIALRTLASGMMAGLTSPARPWFRLAVTDLKMLENYAIKTWLNEVEMSMREVFVRSNLYQVLPVVYGSIGGFGTAGVIELEDNEDVIRFYPFPTGSYFIASSSRQQIDTVFREYSMTVRQLVNEFGIKNVSESVKNAYEQGTYEVWHDVVHCIGPNNGREYGKIDNQNKPFGSWYWEKSSNEDKFLRSTGYEEFPAMFPRWQICGEDAYGSSPVMDALGDIKALQIEQKRKLQAIDKMVNPPMLAEAILRNQRTSLLPGDITYISGLAQSQHAGFRPAYEVNPRIAELSQDIIEVQNRVKRALYEDLMLMFAISDNSQMTAREVEERHQEKLLILGPVMERLNDELLDPIIERTFAIMNRKGMIPPPPPEIEGVALKVEYISIMAQAQKLLGTASIERLAGFVGNIAGIRPDVLDKIDFDQAIDDYANMLGVSPSIVLSDDKVIPIRNARIKAQQAQQAAENLPNVQAGASAAKLLSETGVGESTALNRLLGV